MNDKEALRSITRRTFLKIMGASALATVPATSGLSQWGKGFQTQAATQDVSGNIIFLTEAAADIQKTISDMLKNFGQKYPNVHVTQQTMAGGGLVGGWGQYVDGVTTMIAGGTPPDVVWMATEGLRPFSSKGLLEPLNSYIDRDKAELQDYLNDIPS